MQLRPYQKDAIEALERHFSVRNDNPCVVLPTGSGKSYVIAEMIRRRIENCHDFRCIVLAHRQELVEQNYTEFINLVNSIGLDISVGMYCVGNHRREIGASVTFAMINSVYNHACDFSPVDMVVVDEAHHVPISIIDNGMYREFINGLQSANPELRVVGFTATPYRLGVGHVCHRDYVLNHVCYDVNVGDLIRDGYLCNLRSKISKIVPNVDGVSECGGDYNKGELSNRVCVSELVCNTVRDALVRLNLENRKCVVWFCVDVRHCTMVRDALIANDEAVGMVTGNTGIEERKSIEEDFKRGVVRHLVNVQVFTEGFNVRSVDAVVLLRPTLSRGLYVQMVGRGLRVHDKKQDCIVLDYARCIQEHGPIDQQLDAYVPMEVCCQCEEYFPRALRRCPRCGCVVPEEEARKHDSFDEGRRRIRKMHDEIADCREILASEYGAVETRRVVVPVGIVKLCIMRLAYDIASDGYEYNVKCNRLVPTSSQEFDRFIKDFVLYATNVKLTSLPEMLKDYFESETPHHFEVRRERSEAFRREMNDLLANALNDDFSQFI